MIGLAIRDIARRGRGRGAAPPAPLAPISGVAADGWRAAMPSPADLALAPVAVTRQGFDAAGAPTIHAATLCTTRRVRQPYPAQASLTADTVALSDYVYATDTIAGAANGSAEASPKPIANWSMTDRRIVGNALTVRCVAFHRDGRAGKPVACVVFRATDGTATVSATAASLTATPDPLTGNVILEYVATLDLAPLADNAVITVNARVFPWVGSAASVLDSADQSAAWQFGPRLFRKNLGRAAAPFYVYVKATGSDSGAAVSQDPAAANAAPALTLTGAINRARAVLGSASGSLDGLVVRLDAGTWSRAANPTANVVNAEIVVEPIPGVAKAACVLQFGTANNHFNLNYIRLRGLTLQRTGAFYLHAVAGHGLVIEDCLFDWNGQTGGLGTAAATHDWINVAFSNVHQIGLGNTNGVVHRSFRGCTGGLANSGGLAEMITYLGNAMTGMRLDASAARPQDGGIVAFNRFLAVGSGTSSPIVLSVGTGISGFALVQNLFEYTAAGATPQRGFMPSGDGASPSIAHLVCWHNTFAGFDAYGRGNILYDESAGALRTHRLQSFVGNIHVQINTKGDVFCGLTGVASPGAHLGNWAYSHGVGVRGEFARYLNAAGNNTTGFNQDYAGVGSRIGTSNAFPGQDPLFADYRATAAGPVAGAGGGTYTIAAGSPARGIVVDTPLGFDLAGAPRGPLAAAGAYA